MRLEFKVNGKGISGEISENETLARLLRRLGYTSVKIGCEVGSCGTCTVLVDGDAINSCLYLAAEVDGRKVLTIEGLADADGTLHPIQQSFVDNGAIQCGFCSPGMIMSTKALLDENPNAKLEDIKHALAGNLCRCTGYVQIFEAVKSVKGYRYDKVKVVAWQSQDES